MSLELAERSDKQWYRVVGIRHSAIVRATSEAEAVRKAIDAGAVGDWEDPQAELIGPELPDVVRP